MVTGPPAHAIHMGRRMALATMTDHCKVTRPGPLVTGPDGLENPTTETVYEGPCKVQSYESYEITPTAGEHRFTTQRYQVHFPVDAGPFDVADTVTVDGYRFTFDVTNDFQKTYGTAQRLFVSKVVA